MKQHTPWLALAAAVLLLAPTALADGAFRAYGSYWNVDDLDDSAGAGVAVSFPLGTAWALDLRGTYYEQFDEENFFDQLFDDDENPFLANSIDVAPLELGLSYQFQNPGYVQPRLGGGVTYFLLDTDRGEVDDEAGFYVLGGLDFGAEDGFGFFVDGVYRSAEGDVESSPTDFEEIDDIEGIDFDNVTIDLDGFAVNAGVVWRW
jgi:hypothetical protein